MSFAYRSSGALFDDRSGVSNPRWRQQVSSGHNATTNCSGRKFTVDKVTYGSVSASYLIGTPPSGYVYKEAWTGATSNITVVRTNHFGLPDSFYQKVDNQALSRFYADVRKKRTQISGPTFLGELRETIGMIRRPASNLFRNIDKYLRSAHRAARGIKNPDWRRRIIVDAASDLWLTAQLGWKPLLHDIEDIAIAIARMVHEERHTVCRGFAEDEWKTSSTSYGSRSNYFETRLYDVEVQTFQVIYRGGLRATVADFASEPLNRIRELSGFTVENFIPTVWELIPFSFVIDYFVNIGDLLSAASTDLSDVVWWNRTERRTTEFLHQGSIRSSFPSGLLSWSGGSEFGTSRIVMTDFLRQTITSKRYLSVEFTLPGYLGQIGNIFALIGSRGRP
jgi:hypothetical protein